MKAQQPPHVPAHTLVAPSVSEASHPLGKAAVATTRSWWHPGGHQLHIHCPQMPKDTGKKKNDMNYLESGDLKRVLELVGWKLKSRAVAQ